MASVITQWHCTSAKPMLPSDFATSSTVGMDAGLAWYRSLVHRVLALACFDTVPQFLLPDYGLLLFISPQSF